MRVQYSEPVYNNGNLKCLPYKKEGPLRWSRAVHDLSRLFFEDPRETSAIFGKPLQFFSVLRILAFPDYPEIALRSC